MKLHHQPAFYIQSIPVYGDLVLSPMDGFSDMPFRSICRQLGSAVSYTEFVNTLEMLQAAGEGKPARKLPPAIEQKLLFLPEERPVVFQLFDHDPERLLEAALRLQERAPDAIDINMGCSARSVSGRGAGAGLLRDPLKIAHIFDLLSHHLEVPVTGKIRLGWDDSSRNYLEVARSIADHGGALLAVHARTRQQAYGGQADWQAIAEIKARISIPVLGNGDVRTVQDIERIKNLTGCDGVMIGRGAIGNPWIFSRLDRSQVSPRKVRLLMVSHLERMQQFYGEQRGLVLFRKHASQYLLPSIAPEIRRKLLTTDSPPEFTALVHQIL